MIRRQLPAHSPLTLRGVAGAVADVVRSQSEPLRWLESRLLELLAGEAVRLTDSGTHALQAALAGVAARRPSRPVAIPAYTCYDVATACLGAGVPVLFYDIDPHTLTPELDQVRRCLAEGAVAVVAGPLYGYPLDWTGLRAACEAADALLVEDAAQGTGAGWDGRPSGSFGDLSILSFGRGKGWTGGGGGALIARGSRGQRVLQAAPTTAAAGASVRPLLLCLAQWTLGRPALFGLPSAVPGLRLGETRFHAPTPVGSMAPFAAAAVVRHEQRARGEAGVRRERAAAWRRILDPAEGVEPCVPLDETSCGYLRLPALCTESMQGDLDRYGADAAGVAGGYPQPLPELAEVAAAQVAPVADVSGARRLARDLLTFPTHRLVDPVDLRRVGRVLDRRAAAR